MKKITILIPVYNEARNIPRLAEALRPLIDNKMTDDEYDWEVMMVNDGSTDNSGEELAKLHKMDSRFQHLELSRNFGKESAMLAGMDYSTGDAVIIMDADLQHPMEVIPQMIAGWNQGFDDIYGRRVSRGKESFLRKKLSLAYYKLLQRITSIDILPNVGDFRLLDRRCVNALRQIRETQRYSKGLFSWIGFSKKEILYDQADRTAGKSSFNIGSLFNLAIEGITSFTTAPLRLASIFGLLTAVAALTYLVYILIKTLLYGDPVAGYPTIMCVMLFLGGGQLIALGIIGEYIARIFNESKRRPAYIADSLNGRKVIND